MSSRSTVDLSGLHPSFRAEIAAEATRLQSLWRPTLDLCVSEPEAGLPTDTFAWTEQYAPFPIKFNADRFGMGANPARTRKDVTDESESFSFESGVADILTHEYGHVLHAHLSDRERDAFVRDLSKASGVNLSLDDWLQASQFSGMLGVRMFRKDNYRRLSMYGVEGGPFEAMAEAFAALNKHPHSDAAKIAAKYVGRFHK